MRFTTVIFCDNNISGNELERLKNLFSCDDHSLWYNRKNLSGQSVADNGGENDKNNGMSMAGVTALNGLWKEISENIQTDLRSWNYYNIFKNENPS